MNVMAIDCGNSTGFCIAQVSDNKDSAIILDYGIIEPDTASQFQGDHCLSLQNKIDELIVKWDIQEIGIENYFASSKFCSGTDLNYYYRAATMMLARQRGLHYEVLGISDWKTFIAKRSTPSKEMKAKYGKESAKKIMIVEALWQRFGIRLPNHSISQQTGKPIQFRYDCSDAIGQCLYYCGLRYNISKFSSSVAIPEDVVFKKTSKKTYKYD